MKTLFITLFILIYFTSCGDGDEVQKHNANESIREGHGLHHQITYKCPMECEGDKTYSMSGSCPDCGMDLKEIELHQHENSEDESTSNELNISLNNGEKWEVNEEMMPAINGLKSDLEVFVENDNKNYQVLADQLQGRISELTSSCSMTGQAHDELHKWLMPMVKEVRSLNQSENEQDSKKHLSKIQRLIDQFNQYFR